MSTISIQTVGRSARVAVNGENPVRIGTIILGRSSVDVEQAKLSTSQSITGSIGGYPVFQTAGTFNGSMNKTVDLMSAQTDKICGIIIDSVDQFHYATVDSSMINFVGNQAEVGTLPFSEAMTVGQAVKWDLTNKVYAPHGGSEDTDQVLGYVIAPAISQLAEDLTYKLLGAIKFNLVF